MFIDTHTHLYDAAFGDAAGQDAAVRRALDEGVGKMILPDENSSSRPGMLSLCSRWPGVLFPCIGVHPTELGEGWQQEVQQVLEYGRDRSRKWYAVGETGIDLYWDKSTLGVQQEAFCAQIDLSVELGLPLIVHAREATGAILDILKGYRTRGLRGVFHAYSGSLETFRQLDRYGDWYVGIGGVVTFKKAQIGQIIKDIPLERILLETDSPYLTPVPHRGERNESAYIPLIARFIAGAKCIGTAEVEEATQRNCRILFGI